MTRIIFTQLWLVQWLHLSQLDLVTIVHALVASRFDFSNMLYALEDVLQTAVGAECSGTCGCQSSGIWFCWAIVASALAAHSFLGPIQGVDVVL